jgi:uncharacterized membrane protein
MPVRPGQFVLEGEVIGFVSPPSAQAELARELERHVKLGRHRVLYQDIEFGIAQIVEIAIRALSPAINDTFTGIACVDLLGESLTVLAAGNKSQGRAHDERGVLRLQIRPLRVSRLIKQGFDQIRQAAADNPAVSIRLLSTIGRLGCRMQHPDQLQALREQAAAVWESATSKSPVGMDLEDMEAAWNGAQAKLAEASSRQGVLS